MCSRSEHAGVEGSFQMNWKNLTTHSESTRRCGTPTPKLFFSSSKLFALSIANKGMGLFLIPNFWFYCFITIWFRKFKNCGIFNEKWNMNKMLKRSCWLKNIQSNDKKSVFFSKNANLLWQKCSYLEPSCKIRCFQFCDIHLYPWISEIISDTAGKLPFDTKVFRKRKIISQFIGVDVSMRNYFRIKHINIDFLIGSKWLALT
jgi:hypothetical protein